MPVVGLTGSIASGKSLVSRILKDMGITIVDADLVAREVVKPGQPAWHKIKKTFGSEVLNVDLTINRKLLAEKVFGNEQRLKSLNAITHPVIIEKIAGEINVFRTESRNRQKLLVIDVALLIETGLEKMVDKVWVVYIPEEIQIERLIKRDRITYEQALKRVRSQMSGEEKKKHADAVIDNSGTVEETRERVEQLVQELLNESGVEIN